ncbi:MAG: type IX secretion system sortase PorU [Bacteroidota bacterium]
MNFRFTLVLLLFVNSFAFSQSKVGKKQEQGSDRILWRSPAAVKSSDTETRHFLSFDGAQYAFEDSFLPRYSKKINLNSNERNFNAVLNNPLYEPLTPEESDHIKDQSLISNSISLSANVYISKKKPYGIVSFIPIRKNPGTGKLEKLVSFNLSYTTSDSQQSGTRAVHAYAPNSVLQSGNWYKIAIAADGIYQLSYSFLRNIGIDVASVTPQNIRIYGNGGEMLSELNTVARPDDLVENAIYVQGEGDGTFNQSDYVLFYGKGTNKWTYDSSAACLKFKHSLNLYSDSAYYYITTDLGAGKRIQTQASSALPVTHTVNSFDDYSFHENETVNFIKSGRLWFGEYFENTNSYNFSFAFPNIDVSGSASVNTSLASRYLIPGSAAYSISSQSGSTTLSIPNVSGSSYDNYAKIQTACYSFTPSSSTITVNVSKQTTDAVAWLDYVEVNVRRLLTMSGSQLIFRDSKSIGSGNIAQYNINSSQPIQIWDITDIYNVKAQTTATPSSSIYQFILPSDSLKQFVAFTGSSFNTPAAGGMVANQDLHAISSKDFIIIAHPDFYQDALQLAAHHESRDTLSTIVVTPQQIYNEFSSGAQSVPAIRDFVKMFYDRASSTAEMPKYLLLFGDGSYENKPRPGNSNFIPTYQSENSTIPTSSYVSDDFFGLLDDGEGVWNFDAVDIGIGRFPVKTPTEAHTAVSKIMTYTKTGVPLTENTTANCTGLSATSPFGSWRNTVCFIGDDEDSGIHTFQANQQATLVDTTYQNFNIDKIYLDAYQQEATPGGSRYPDVADAINKRVEKGSLIINYTGHGGEVGLAHERVIELSQINKWNNINNLFLFFTATCEFSRYDDPERTSAGEYAFLNPNGGAIALYSTVRLVFASPNFYLNKDFYTAAFEPINGRMPRLGDLYEYIKNQSGGNSVNSRNFTLLGDPALTLAYPKYEVVTDSVNSIAVTGASSDTLKALSAVTISGHLNDNNGALLSNYNGILYPTVYDKPQDITTLSNDGSLSPPFTFKLQKNILYKGKVTVTNGYYKFSFIVPKDIAYQYGIGRISYYAENGNEDAQGYYEKIIIGGSNDLAVSDAAGPEVNVYLNDIKFVFGGLTDENPDLYSILKDANGINTVGNGIGHDITAVIDGNTEKSIILNDYYQSDLNSYKSGTIRYPLEDMSEGKHTLKLKVWDVYNNSSESYTEFIVAKSAKLALSHVLNYPNPFTTRTQFYFEHNQTCSTLEVQVQVFTVSGKLVKNISQFVNTEGFRSEPIEWNGRDDFGDKIGKGVYVYRVKVKTSDGGTAEKYEKLVILN